MTSHPHIHTKVTGDGHRGIGHTGDGSSAIGYRESASGRVGTASRHSCIDFAAGRTMVGARFIVHSFAEGAAKPRPYPRDRIRFGWRVAASGGGWRVDTISGPGSRPSGAWCGYSGSGAGPGPDTRKIGVIKSSRGDRKPDDWLGIYFQVTGDGHRGIGHSGVGISASGYREPASGRVGTASRHSCLYSRVASGSPRWRVAARYNFGSQVSAIGDRVRVFRFRYRYRSRA